MKTIEEWIKKFYCLNVPNAKVDKLIEFIKDIQSDAFHAGNLAGIKEAQEIVRCRAIVLDTEVVKAIDSMDKQ